MSVQCRTCGEYIYNLSAKNLYEDNSTLHKIEVLTGIWLTDELDMPEHICACCVMDLNHAIKFRERCIKTQQLLLRDKLKVTPGNFTPGLDDSELDPLNSVAPREDDCDIIENDTIVESFESANEFFEDSAIDFIETANEVEVETTAKAMPVLKICDKLKTVRVVIEPQIAYSKSPNMCGAQSSPSTLQANRRNAMETRSATSAVKSSQIAPTSQAFSEPAMSPRKKKKYPSLNGYVCDQCGWRFKDFSNLKVHLVRHKGIKQYECHECDEKFYTTHLLNLHIRVRHKGEKPYACKHCEERFYTSTSRCNHEALHLNERQHVCKFCRKAFLTKSKLTNHEILHRSDRPHRCETCDMGFKHKQYLRTHNRSKLHLKKVGQLLETQNAVQGISGEVADDVDFEFSDSFIEESE